MKQNRNQSTAKSFCSIINPEGLRFISRNSPLGNFIEGETLLSIK